MGIDADGYFLTKRILTDEEEKIFLDEFLDCGFSYWGREGEKPFRIKDGSLHIINFGMSRYYSQGYARGAAEKIIPILGWLRRHPMVEAVFYGGDAMEVSECQLWTEEFEGSLIDYWLRNGHTDRIYPAKKRHEWKLLP